MYFYIIRHNVDFPQYIFVLFNFKHFLPDVIPNLLSVGDLHKLHDFIICLDDSTDTEGSRMYNTRTGTEPGLLHTSHR